MRREKRDPLTALHNLEKWTKNSPKPEVDKLYGKHSLNFHKQILAADIRF